jgi:hypothetical protein
MVVVEKRRAPAAKETRIPQEKRRPPVKPSMIKAGGTKLTDRKIWTKISMRRRGRIPRRSSQGRRMPAVREPRMRTTVAAARAGRPKNREAEEMTSRASSLRKAGSR